MREKSTDEFRLNSWKLALTLALPPDSRQIVKDFPNGLRRRSPTMHTRKCMVGLRNFHGWTPQLPWLDSATSMVGLRNFHGSAARLAWFSFCASIHQLLNPVFDPETGSWTKDALDNRRPLCFSQNPASRPRIETIVRAQVARRTHFDWMKPGLASEAGRATLSRREKTPQLRFN